MPYKDPDVRRVKGNERTKKWRDKNRSTYRIKDNAYKKMLRLKDPEKGKIAYAARDKEKVRQFNKKYNDQAKVLVISAYGGACACCGEKHASFLTIDHTNNDGKEHRKIIGASGNTTYKWLKRQGFPKDGFRLLCYNCNLGRRHGECPHKKDLP